MKLRPFQVILCQNAVKIHGHFMSVQMEADIIIAEEAVDGTRKEMFPRMLLHIGKPFRKIDSAAD